MPAEQLQTMSFQRSLADISIHKDQSSRCSRTETFSQLSCSIGGTIPKNDDMADTQSAESVIPTPQESLISRPIGHVMRKSCTETVTQNTVTLSPVLSTCTANGHLVPITQDSGNTHGVTSSTLANTSFQAEPTPITKIGITDNDNDVRSTQSTGIVAPSRFPITSMEDSQRIQRPDAITQTQPQPFSFPSLPNKIEQTNDKSPKPGIKAIQQPLFSMPSTSQPVKPAMVPPNIFASPLLEAKPRLMTGSVSLPPSQKDEKSVAHSVRTSVPSPFFAAASADSQMTSMISTFGSLPGSASSTVFAFNADRQEKQMPGAEKTQNAQNIVSHGFCFSATPTSEGNDYKSPTHDTNSMPVSSKLMVFAAKHQEKQQPSPTMTQTPKKTTFHGCFTSTPNISETKPFDLWTPATPSTETSVAQSNHVGQQTTQQPQLTPFVLAEGTPTFSFASLTSSSTEAFKASGDFKGFQGAGQHVFSGKHSSPREQSRSLNENVKLDDTKPNDDSERAVELQDHDDMQTGEQEEIASQAQMFSFNTESLISTHKTTEPNDGTSVNANSEVMPVSSAAPLTSSTGTSVAQSKPAGQQMTQQAQSTDCPFELTQRKPSLSFASLTSNVTEAFNESGDFIDFREAGQQVFDGQPPSPREHSRTINENDKMDDTESNEKFKPEVEPQDHDDMQTGEHVKQKLVENQAQQSPSPRTGNITISEVEPNMDLFAMFKQQLAPWKCDRCFIHNNSYILKCSVCYSLKPGVEAEDVNV